MTLLQAAFLGLVQGLTEFLPVSSSGHLAIAQHFLTGFKQPGLLFDVLLHAGTMAAVILYFRRDLLRLILSCGRNGDADDRRVLLLLILASVPTAIIGLAAKDTVERLFTVMPVVGGMLLLTGLLLFYAARANVEGRDMAGMNKFDALLVGIAQGLAVMPGISRSGATIGCLLLRGVGVEAAARFSFLLALPAVGGATLLHVKDLGLVETTQLPAYLVGTLVAFFSGLAAIRVLMGLLRRRRLGGFALYCFLLGSVIMASTWIPAG